MNPIEAMGFHTRPTCYYTQQGVPYVDERIMKKILFVCHGNICRSPMAEFVMKYLVEKERLTDQFMIESAATSTEEIGNPVYPPARRKLAEHGIRCVTAHSARQITRAN